MNALGYPTLGDEKFEAFTRKYESEGKGRKTIKAQELWFKVVESSDRNRRPLHAVQGCGQLEVQPAELGDDRLPTSARRSSSTPPRRGGGVQPRVHRTAEVCDKMAQFDHDKLFEVTYQVDQEPEPRHRPELLPDS